MNIALKYRPNTFQDLIGQGVLVQVLHNSFILDKIPQSILLAGSSGVGKTTTARIIALCLNCSLGPTPNPCGVCSSCTAIKNSRHPDVIELDAASHTGIEDIKVILENACYLPINSGFKVYIIDEAHMLSNSAFNALLKTLEEPLSNIKFILATTEIKKIPGTVISRCQRFNLERVQASNIIEHLSNIAKKESLAFEVDALKLIARNSDGSMRNALFLLNQAMLYSSEKEISASIVENILSLTDRETLFDLVLSLLEGNYVQTLITFKKACKNANSTSLLEELLQTIHLLCCFSITGVKNDTITEYEMRRIIELSKKKPLTFMLRLWQVLFKGIQNVKISSCSDSFSEMVLINLCCLADLPSPTQVVKNILTDKNNYRDLEMLHNITKEQNEKKDYNFQEILELLDQNKQISLYKQLCHSVELISCNAGCLRLKPKVLLCEGFAAKLSQCLNALTKIEWYIVIDDYVDHVEVSQNIPSVKKVLDVFEGAKIKNISKQYK